MDLKLVKDLLGLMREHELAEIEIEQEGQKVRLRKHAPPAPPNMVPMLAPAGQAPAPTGHATAPAAAAPVGPQIKAPSGGTFSRGSTPETPPFVEVGDRVKADTVVCILEAMKVMNEIKADVAGTIDAVLVENGESVEFGQPLFAVRPG